MNSHGPSFLAKSFVALLSAAAMAAVPLLTVNYVAQAQAQSTPPAAEAPACCKEKDGKKSECGKDKKGSCPKDAEKKACCPAGK